MKHTFVFSRHRLYKVYYTEDDKQALRAEVIYNISSELLLTSDAGLAEILDKADDVYNYAAFKSRVDSICAGFGISSDRAIKILRNEH